MEHHKGHLMELAKHFFEKMKGDDDLEGIFKDVDEQKYAHHPETFHAHAFGEEKYSADEIAHAHKNLGLSSQHFEAMVDHFVDTLADHGYGDDEKQQAREMLSKYRDQVLGK